MKSLRDNNDRTTPSPSAADTIADAPLVQRERSSDVATMDILLYGLNFEPELTGIGKYSGEMARWLVHKGHHVDVVTAPPYYPEWEVREGYSGWSYQNDRKGMPEGLNVLRCPLWVPKRVTGLKRIIHLASFALSSGPALFLTALKRRPSVLMLVVPTLACAPAALLVGWLLRIPTWLHVQDFELDAMHAMGIAQGASRMRRLQFAIETWILRRFDRVSSISPKMVERLASKGVDADKRVEFPNWVDVSIITPQDPSWEGNAVRSKLKLPPNAVVVLYAGNIGKKQGLEVVIDAARMLVDKPLVQFVFVGSGAALEDLQRYSQDLPNIQWLPLQPFELLNDLLNAADIHVLPQQANAADLVMPSKLTGMLASGRAVIGTADADTQLGMVLDTCGVRTQPGDSNALAAAIETLAGQPEERRRLGAEGRDYALKHLSHTAILSTFEADLRKLVKSV